MSRYSNEVNAIRSGLRLFLASAVDARDGTDTLDAAIEDEAAKTGEVDAYKAFAKLLNGTIAAGNELTRSIADGGSWSLEAIITVTFNNLRRDAELLEIDEDLDTTLRALEGE